MSQTERLYKLKSLLDAGQCLTKARLLEELPTSPATLKRDIAHLRDRMNAPIVFDRERGGWRLDRAATVVGTQYELPGLWLSAEEIHALLTMQHLLAHLDAGGLLAPHIEPMMKRLRQMLVAPGKGAPTHEELTRRIHVQTVGARKLHLPHFQAVGTALLRRQRLQIEYHGRGSNLVQPREVSPQRLIHYRQLVPGRLVPPAPSAAQLQRRCHPPGAGARSNSHRRARDRARQRARRRLRHLCRARSAMGATALHPRPRPLVAAETWHPLQKGRFDADGHWLLDLPYADPRELVMDILRHVPEVEVLEPVGLREMVAEKLLAGVEKMGGRLTP